MSAAAAARRPASGARLPRRVVWVFVGALALVVAELGWWTFFHIRFSRQQGQWQAQQWSEEREAAARLVLLSAAVSGEASDASPAAVVAAHFPRLVWRRRAADAPPPAGPNDAQVRARFPDFVLTVAPQAMAELAGRERAHVRMFVSEGAFFLLVLALGAWMLWRILGHEVALLRQQGNFLSAVTHELKSPIAAIRLFCETLQMRRLEPDRQARYLNTMLREVERLDGMVGNLLTTARLEAGRFAARRDQVDLGALVAECVGPPPDMQQEGEQGRPVCDFRPPAEPLFVSGDRAALGCIVRNLLDNAAKYGRHPERPVEVTVARRGAQATVAVRDFGTGLGALDLARVFDKFFRVGDEMVRQSEGTGLGLYLARALAEAHGGALEAHSAGPGEGSTFTLALPAARGARAA